MGLHMKKFIATVIAFMSLVSWTTAGQVQPMSGPGNLLEPITPIPLSIEVDENKAALGRKLFFDTRLSKDGTISCESCHHLNSGGVDHVARSIGVGGAEGGINAPTVYNAALNFVQFWDGRANTLEEQVVGPIHNPVEMATNWDDVIAELKQDAKYVRQFSSLYPDGLAPDNITHAIAEFERTLLTPNSPFDQFLRGEEDAISAEAKEGYLLFKSYGCSACHQGRNVGGNMYEKMGVVHDYFATRTDITEADYGRFNVTGHEDHKFEFKVPSLRNIALTAPYFHDGSAETLEEAVRTMARYQLGRLMSDHDLIRIVAFLRTLTGKHKELDP